MGWKKNRINPQVKLKNSVFHWNNMRLQKSYIIGIAFATCWAIWFFLSGYLLRLMLEGSIFWPWFIISFAIGIAGMALIPIEIKEKRYNELNVSGKWIIILYSLHFFIGFRISWLKVYFLDYFYKSGDEKLL